MSELRGKSEELKGGPRPDGTNLGTRVKALARLHEQASKTNLTMVGEVSPVPSGRPFLVTKTKLEGAKARQNSRGGGKSRVGGWEDPSKMKLHGSLYLRH